MLERVLVPIHRAGWPFIAAFLAAALLLGLLSGTLFWLGLIATAWCVYFFRDPPRYTPVRPGLLVSPADGVIEMIAQAAPPPELEMGAEELTRVSIFLNVFDVHINRIPIGGRVARIAYRPGKFFNAALDKASEENERNALRIDLDTGESVAVVQIAGLVARRILCHIHEGETLRSGERFGLIRFGSRTDLYLPKGVEPQVALGQRVLGGESVIADMMSKEPQRFAEVR
ncbi:MAG: phosphatidylserine decarboxylase [Rhodovibrionaceae bacterium]